MPQVNPLSLLAPSSGEDSYMTAEALKRRRLLAQSLMSGQGRPQATTRGGVLAKGIEGFMGGYAMRKANEKEAAQRQALANALKGSLPEGQHGIADADPDFAKRLYAAQMQAKMAAEAEARRAAAEANKPGTMKTFIDGRDAIIETRGGRPVMNPDGTYKVVGSPKTDMLSEGAEGQKIRIAKAGRANTNINIDTFEKKTAGTIEDKILSTGSVLSNLMDAKESFDPQFLTYGGKLDAFFTGLKDKAGYTPGPEERGYLERFAKFQQNSYKTLNERIKAMAGSAVSENEMSRMVLELPSSGTGIFDGDSPTAYRAKLNNAIEKTKIAMARLNYIRRDPKTFGSRKPWEAISLDRMEKVIDSTGDRLESEFRSKNPGANDAAIQAHVRSQLTNMFGVRF